LRLKATTGIIILVSSPLAQFLVGGLWATVEFCAKLYLSGLEFEFASNLIMNGPFCTLTIVGLALYIAGRKEFWKSADTHEIKNISILLVVLGLFLSIMGFWFSLGTYSIAWYYSHKGGVERPFNQLLLKYSPTLLLTILWFVSGITLLADSLKQLASKVRS